MKSATRTTQKEVLEEVSLAFIPNDTINKLPEKVAGEVITLLVRSNRKDLESYISDLEKDSEAYELLQGITWHSSKGNICNN